MRNTKHTPGPWRNWLNKDVIAKGPDGIHDVTVASVPVLFGGNGETQANIALMCAAPLGYELAEALLAQEQDGLDRSEWILEKAREFMRAAEGEQK